jgi:hypothetical protein
VPTPLQFAVRPSRVSQVVRTANWPWDPMLPRLPGFRPWSFVNKSHPDADLDSGASNLDAPELAKEGAIITHANRFFDCSLRSSW